MKPRPVGRFPRSDARVPRSAGGILVVAGLVAGAPFPAFPAPRDLPGTQPAAPATGPGADPSPTTTSGPGAPTATASDHALPPAARPSPRDRCPVCGMFVAPYPEWWARIRFRDGTDRWFDGAKDMFRFLADLPRLAPGWTKADLESVVVTDYYDVVPVLARSAWFVVGSDVLGPMGHELVPHATREAADEFALDHRGREVLGFEAVTPELLAGLH